jgi:hypothetical protein
MNYFRNGKLIRYNNIRKTSFLPDLNNKTTSVAKHYHLIYLITSLTDAKQWNKEVNEGDISRVSTNISSLTGRLSYTHLCGNISAIRKKVLLLRGF